MSLWQFSPHPTCRTQLGKWGTALCCWAKSLGAADLGERRTTSPCTPGTTWGDRNTARRGVLPGALCRPPGFPPCSVSVVSRQTPSACSRCSFPAPDMKHTISSWLHAWRGCVPKCMTVLIPACACKHKCLQACTCMCGVAVNACLNVHLEIIMIAYAGSCGIETGSKAHETVYYW